MRCSKITCENLSILFYKGRLEDFGRLLGVIEFLGVDFVYFNHHFSQDVGNHDSPNQDDNVESTWTEVVDNFDDMNLREKLLRGIFAYGFEKPSAIQQRAIIPAIKGRLTLPALFISKSCIKLKINLNFYFHTSLWCLKRFCEGL